MQRLFQGNGNTLNFLAFGSRFGCRTEFLGEENRCHLEIKYCHKDYNKNFFNVTKL